jgi:hypothetical protein
MPRLRFSNDYTTAGGRAYKGGNAYEVNAADARSLITRGKAVAEPAEKAPAPAEAKPSAPAENPTPKGS